MSAAQGGALRAVAFDLDGTLYLGGQAVPGASEIVTHVRKSGLAVLFLTNSNVAGPQRLKERLAGHGIAASLGEIYSSATGAARYCAERGYRLVYVVGETGLRHEVAAFGLEVTATAAAAQALVVGFVPRFDPQTLPTGFRPDCEFVVTNVDVDYPVEGGVRMPGSGQTVGRVAARLRRGYDVCVGKPGTYLLECVERDLGLSAAEIVVVGDSAASDIAMAKAAGCPSILIGFDGAGDGGASAAVPRLIDLPAALEALGGA